MPLLFGGIVMWSGTIGEIPQKWALCNGQNGTIDLRNMFVVGAGDTYNVEDTGGFADATLVSHSHTGSTDTAETHSHGFIRVKEAGASSTLTGFGQRVSSAIQGRSSSTNGAHTHTSTIDTGVGEDPTNKNLPPYYALAYIQQVEE